MNDFIPGLEDQRGKPHPTHDCAFHNDGVPDAPCICGTTDPPPAGAVPIVQGMIGGGEKPAPKTIVVTRYGGSRHYAADVPPIADHGAMRYSTMCRNTSAWLIASWRQIPDHPLGLTADDMEELPLCNSCRAMVPDLPIRERIDHRPQRGDAVEAWLKVRRDGFDKTSTYGGAIHMILDGILDDYRLAADMGMTLEEIERYEGPR